MGKSFKLVLEIKNPNGPCYATDNRASHSWEHFSFGMRCRLCDGIYIIEDKNEEK